jgi:hypothetical protein
LGSLLRVRRCLLSKTDSKVLAEASLKDLFIVVVAGLDFLEELFVVTSPDILKGAVLV